MNNQNQNGDYKTYLPALGRFLAIRDRSEYEVQQYLQYRLKVKDQDHCLQIIKYLKNHQMINDKKFAKMWAESKLNSGHGWRKIATGLRQRGIADNLINQTLKSIPDTVWYQTLLSILEKKAPSFATQAYILQKQKLTRFLMGRGFLPRHIRLVIDDYFAGKVK